MNVPSVRNEAALMPDKLHSFALPPVVVVLYSCLRLPKGRLLVICSSCQLADDDDNTAVDLSRLLFEYLHLVNNILLNSQMIFNIMVFCSAQSHTSTHKHPEFSFFKSDKSCLNKLLMHRFLHNQMVGC